jgi:hypothetical protein
LNHYLSTCKDTEKPLILRKKQRKTRKTRKNQQFTIHNSQLQFFASKEVIVRLETQFANEALMANYERI